MVKTKHFDKMKQIGRKFIFISYPIVVLICLFLIYCHIDDNNRRKKLYETRKEGYKIAVALRQYHNNKNKYPITLGELVPNYLDKLQQPRWGDTGWLYMRSEKDYLLQVGYKSSENGDYIYPALHYNSSGPLQGYLND